MELVKRSLPVSSIKEAEKLMLVSEEGSEKCVKTDVVGSESIAAEKSIEVSYGMPC